MLINNVRNLIRRLRDTAVTNRGVRTLDLWQLEERIVFTAEAQIAPTSDAAELGVGDPDLHSIMVEPRREVQTGSDDLPGADEAVVAFPGAEGFGAYAQGGRGGDVYHVTNLEDGGLGSFRYGVESMAGPRTIVFDISGTINLESRLSVTQPYLTIAGQTAPGDGITIANHRFQILDTHDIIVRYLRMRTGDQDIANSDAVSHDTFSIIRSHDIMVDHVSMSWGIDETLSTVESSNVTVQWSIISESLSDSFHPKGEHGLAMLSYGGSLSLHHNLFAHHDHRMPRLTDISADVVNNVFYDWRKSYPSSVGDSTGESELSQVNFVNNVYIAGPSKLATLDAQIVFWGRDLSAIWADGNVLDANFNGLLDVEVADFSLHPNDPVTFVESRIPHPIVSTDDALLAYERVLDSSGASIIRDEVDARVVGNVKNQTGAVIDSQTSVGGLPELQSTPASADADQDGMPDTWELSFSYLDPNRPDDRNADFNGDGYTNLETYLNQISDPIPQSSLAITGAATVPAKEVFALTIVDDQDLFGRDAIHQFQVDWNGDSRVDQWLQTEFGTPIEHVFEVAGDYTVQIQGTLAGGQTVQLNHELTVGVHEQPAFDNQMDGSSMFWLSSHVLLGETVILVVHGDGPPGVFETYEIDWDGDSQADQSVRVSDRTAVGHVYPKSGRYMVAVNTLTETAANFIGTVEVRATMETIQRDAVLIEPLQASNNAERAAHDFHVVQGFLSAASKEDDDEDEEE